MKNKLIILVMFFSYNIVYGQIIPNPTLKLEGSNFSYAKGNIDTELLTEIIQQKQEEFAQRAFKNLVLKNFNKPGAEQSFASYYYIYNLLNTLTTEKNKKVITRQVINNILEYSLVYGLTKLFVESEGTKNLMYKFDKKDEIPKDSVKLSTPLNDSLLKAEKNKKVKIPKDSVKLSTLLNDSLLDVENNKNGVLYLRNGKKSKVFNMYMDMAYDILLKDSTMHKKGLFKSINQSNTWYNEDNAYLINMKNGDDDLIRGTVLMKKYYLEVIKKNNQLEDICLIINDLPFSNFKPESLTKKQYDTIRKIINMAIFTLKNYSDDNIIATMSEFLLDYTLVEYKEDTTIKKDSTSKTGILYIDAEGLISSLYEKFANSNKSSTISKKFGFLIPKPFLTIGTSYVGTLQNGNLLISDNGTVSDLNNLYFASEKIGFKFTLDDKKYTRSFGPAEQFEYHGRKTAWIRPQPMPIIVRQEIMIYGSGLLYNIVDIKSKKNFNYAMAGVAYGLTFFNGLVLSAGVSAPIDANNGVSFNKKLMYNISFDIPIIEYISALKKKK